MRPILFTIGGVKFYSFGFLVALGFLISYLIILHLVRKKRLDQNYLFDRFLIIFIAGLLGARLTYFILYHSQFSSPWQFFYFWQGGLVSWGGILIALLTSLFIFRKNFLTWFDLIAVGGLLGWTIGRIGCFLNGCCLGLESNSPLAIQGKLPVTLWEGGASFLLFLFTYWLLGKEPKRGVVFLIGIAIYSLVRFLIDWGRADPILILGLKLGQLTSLGILIIALIGVWYTMRIREISNAR